jgi:transcriptional regulator with XRE-family HTH domain
MPAISPRHRAFGDAIRALRDRRGLTQESLADRCGLTTNYVGDMERGERNVSIRALWQLADGLDVPASELLREAERQEAGKSGQHR